jgi:hypothetical protein
MRRIWLSFVITAALTLPLAGCGGGEGDTGTVASGTYTGTIQQVKPGEKEIYVKTADGQVLELYFTDQTKLTRDGSEAEFSTLAKNQQVEVEVTNEDGELLPQAVTITGDGGNGGGSE